MEEINSLNQNQKTFDNLSSEDSDYSFNSEDGEEGKEIDKRSDTVTSKEIKYDLDYYIEYNNSHLEKIICIELINNNKIYLNYESSWKIQNVK